MCLRNNPWHWSVREPNFCVITLLNGTVGAACAWEFTVIESRLVGQVRGHGSKPQTPILGGLYLITWLHTTCSSFRGCDTEPLFGQPLLLPPPSYHRCHLMWTVNKDGWQPWVVMDCLTCSLFTLVLVVMKSAVNIVFLWNRNLCLLKEFERFQHVLPATCQRSPRGGGGGCGKTDFVCLPHVALVRRSQPPRVMARTAGDGITATSH